MALLRMMFLGLMVVAALAEPEAKPEPAADPQYYDRKYPQPTYNKPAYKPDYPSYRPEYPSYKPAYERPAYDKPAYERPAYDKPAYDKPAYAKPAYPAYGPSYKKDNYYCDPRAAPKCVQHNISSVYCLSDYEYPEQEIQYAIEYDPLVLKKYAEVADQSANNLVDGVTASQENQFDYSLYNGNTFDKGNWIGGEGYICPSEVLYARPVRALNVDGEWRVIVQNVAYYTQTQRVETCLFPGASCRTLAPCFRSTCVQKYVYHRMLSFDPCEPHRGLFIDSYKLPSACSCHIPSKHA